jgi:hypothetical protein
MRGVIPGTVLRGNDICRKGAGLQRCRSASSFPAPAYIPGMRDGLHPHFSAAWPRFIASSSATTARCGARGNRARGRPFTSHSPSVSRLYLPVPCCTTACCKRAVPGPYFPLTIHWRRLTLNLPCKDMIQADRDTTAASRLQIKKEQSR